MNNPSDISVQYIKGVGPSRKKVFSRLGVETVEDLLYFFPRRYEDRRQMTPLSQLRIGEWQTVTGNVLTHSGRRSWHTRKHVMEVIISDGKSRLAGVWFNQPYLEQYFKRGQRVVFYGKVDVYQNRLQMVAPEYEILEEEDEGLSVGRIVPIYSLTRGITQRYMRKIIKACLDKYVGALTDPLPFTLRQKHRLQNLARSILDIHFPKTQEEQIAAYRRVAFEEFFLFQISIILRRLSIVQKPGIAHCIPEELLPRFMDAFPFSLTGAQKRVLGEMAADMAKGNPMHRLLEGDVGSGKTLVALFGCVVATHNGYQAAIMAPTEILARQHYARLCTFIENGKWLHMRPALLLSTISQKEKAQLYNQIKTGEVNCVVGTHALIQEAVDFNNLSFVVIDEQHKFGVRQRALLPEKGVNPDVLIMTATPIPRTLSLTLFGDLDISTIDEMPPGRGKVETRHFLEEEAEEAYRIARQLVEEGQQAYIIYPIIDESEKLELKAAEQMFKHFQKHEFKGLRLGLVHGQMRQKDVQDFMEKFRRHEIDILVATTVLEVGVDVPNANVMIIEHADRFGLSQLHQLRGRIGRSGSDALCILIASPTTPEAKMRLEAILSTQDGFKIAQQDLMIRGPGQFFGRHQHGLNELRIADPSTQLDILEIARKEAINIIDADPHLTQPPHRLIKAFIEKRYPTYLAMAKAG